MRLPDWPAGERECLLEYRTTSISGVGATNVGARLARRYYVRRLGGIYYFTGARNDRMFLMVDSRWCSWFAVDSGLRAVR
jgi:hypothetical protein